MLCQFDAIRRQNFDLVRGQTGLVLRLQRDRNLLQASSGIGHQLHGFMGNFLIQDGQISLADAVGVRGNDAVHRIGSQAPDRADEQVVVPDIEGMVGIHHAAGHGVHHLEADDAHGDIFVPDALVEAIGDGPGRVETGQDFLVSRNQLICRHIQEGEVLPRKGQIAVFADGAGTHGDPYRRLS